MLSSPLRLIAAALFASRAVYSLVINQNTVETILDDIFAEDLTILPGAYYWLLNNNVTVLGGSVRNQGAFYVTTISGKTSDVSATGTIFHNEGSIEFNTMDSYNVSVYNIAPVEIFNNSGSMYLGVSGGDLSGQPFTVISGTSWTNTGMMVFERASGSAVPVVIGHKEGVASVDSIKNEGAICLYNANWIQTTYIAGDGCITVGEGSKLEVRVSRDEIGSPVAQDQIINLEASSSELAFLGLSQEFLSAFPKFRITGLGGGNTVSVDRTFKGFHYNPDTGILKLKYVGSFGLMFDIGKSYSPKKFRKSSSGGRSTISYGGACPNSAPGLCSCKKVFPDVNILPSPDT